MLTIKHDGSYKKASKTVAGRVNTVNRYVVSGSKADVEAFASAQKENARTNEAGEQLFFSVKFLGAQGKLIKTSDGRFVPDTSKMDQIASLIEQNPGPLGAELAKLAAADLMRGLGAPVSQDVTANIEAK